MKKVSLLLFSRNDIDKALDLIGEMQSSVDEVVLFDSSDRKIHDELVRKTKGYSGLRVFYIIPLSYLEPTIMYAFKKCRYRYVLLLGTDERMSSELEVDLHKILEQKPAAAFAIRRYEDVSSGKRNPYVNWQIRLFDKEKTEFRGLIHEEPTINGKLVRLDDEDYYIDHVKEIRGNAAKEYMQMEKFLRMSYESYNEILLDYLYKFTMPESKERRSRFGRFSLGALRVYEKLGGKKPGQELSNFDYCFFYTLRAATTAVKEHSVSGFLGALPEGMRLTRIVKEWKGEQDGDEIFEISKILHKMGLIRFLQLDKESTIERLNKKYRFGKEKGISLLFKLLKERYEDDYAKVVM